VLDDLRIYQGTHAELMLEALSPAVGDEAPTVNVLQPIHVWADGSGTGSSTDAGPAGAGYVIRYHDAKPYVVGMGVPLGKGTSNFAELSAIQKALESIPVAKRTRPVTVTSDSQYALGACSGRNKVNANGPLIFAIRALTKTFRSIQWKHCKGHTGIPENEACDRLAGRAAREQRSIELHEVAQGS
jgi:ribonuclease HI